MSVQWQEDLCIGVLEIDIQHKLLFGKFSAFLSAYDAKKDSDEINRIFWFLEAYAITHFKDEEKLMQQIGFPDYPVHRERHQAFVTRVGEFKERLRTEGATESVIFAMSTFITGWLLDHISTMDRAIGQFVTSEKLGL